MFCPLCNKKITASNNFDITGIIEKHNKTLNTLKEVAYERLLIERMENDEALLDKNSNYYNKPAEYAIDKFMFFQCNVCKNPYFAGLKQCRGIIERNYKKEDLVCGGCCKLNGIPGVTDCRIHGKAYIDFKCRFCCSVACWQCGSTHYCDDCHTKFPKEPKKCRGKKYCELNIEHPANGEEFALGCSLCRYNKEEALS